MAESFFEKRKRELGLTTGGADQVESAPSSFFEQRKMDLGLIQDTRPNAPSAFEEALSAGSITAPYRSVLDTPSRFNRPGPYTPVQPEEELPGRDIPVIGSVLRGLDYVGEKVEDSGVGSFLRSFYTPGASVANIAGATGAVGRKLTEGAMKVAPNLAPKLESTLGGRILQEGVKEGTVGLPVGVGQALSSGETDIEKAAKEGLIGGALVGGGVGAAIPAVGAGLRKFAGSNIGDALTNFMNRNRVVDAPQQEILALPPASRYERVKAAAEGTVLPTNETPIYGRGDIKTFELPESTTIPRVVNEIQEETAKRQLNAQNRLEMFELSMEQKYNSANTDVNALDNLKRKEATTLNKLKREATDTNKVASQVAKERGLNWNDLQQGRVVTGSAASPVDTVGFKSLMPKQSAQTGIDILPPKRKFATESKATNSGPAVISKASKIAESTPKDTPLTRPMVDDATLVSGTAKTAARSAESAPVTDELGFARTVRESDQTPPELKRMLNEQKLTGNRTSDAINLQEAEKLINRHGADKLADRIVSKKTPLNAVENTAAQMLARYYSETGQLDKAINVISQTARSGRELGQAIQALSRWNKLDQEGALMLAERQLNRRNADINDWQKLTPEQAKPVQEAAQKLEKVQNVKQMTDQLVKILVDKPKGAALTAEEKALIKQLNDTVNQVDKEVSPLLKKQKEQRAQTIKEIRAIKPKERTRDQVVNYLDAQAERAREALRRQRNLGIVSDKTNPVFLYAVIGASKIAKGTVKFSDWSQQMIKDGITDQLGEVYLKAVKKFRKENGLPTNKELNILMSRAIKENKIDDETANSLRVMAAEIGFFADDAKLELTQDLQRAMKGLGSSTLGEKLSTLQTSAMLLNVPTFLRNALGNVQQLTVEKLNKVAAAPIDWAFSKMTKERTVRFFSNNQEKFWRNFAIGTKSGWEGISPTGTLDSYDIKPDIFGKRNPLKYISKTLGASLQGMDYAGYNVAYGDVLATYATNLGKVKGLTTKQIKEQMPDLIKQLDDRVYEIADQAGLYTTYQDDTLLSMGAQAVKRGLNKITDVPSKYLRERGILPESLSTEGFGLGDVVLKFARTPANLVMRGIDYSPLGIVRSMMEIAPLFRKSTREKFNQREATLALSRAITGTLGFTGLGAWMAHNGILTGAASQDADVRSIEEQSGKGAYKVNWSALGRWITSGLDKESAKYQKGDVMMDYAWLQPVAISLGMGVNAAEAYDKPLKPGEERDNYKIATQAILGGLRTVLENPMLTGLSNVADASGKMIKNQDASGFTNILKGVPASFVPSAVGQLRTGSDNTQRETFDKNTFNAMWNQIKNKLPGASKTLPVSYDSLGNARERIQGGESGTIGQFLNSLLNPAKFTTYNVSPDAKLVLDVMDASNDPNVLPRIGKKYIEVDDPITKQQKKVDLTAEQFSKLQRKMGEKVSSELKRYEAFLSAPDRRVESKVNKIKDILTKVGTDARNEIRVEMGYKKKR